MALAQALRGDSAGFFGALKGAAVDDLRLLVTYSGASEGSTGRRYYGPLAGTAENSSISDVFASASGSLTAGGPTTFGGLVGRLVDSAVTNSVVDLSVSVAATSGDESQPLLFGGVAGEAERCTISHVTGKVVSSASGSRRLEAGGVVGRAYAATHVTNFAFEGTINGRAGSTALLGGVVGLLEATAEAQTILNGTTSFTLTPFVNEGELLLGGVVANISSTASPRLEKLEARLTAAGFSVRSALIGGVMGYGASVDASRLSVSGQITGQVTGDTRVGGAFGAVDKSNIRDCISRVSIDVDQGAGVTEVGGFIGSTTDNGAITRCGAYGGVSLKKNAPGNEDGHCGGFVGKNHHPITVCFASGAVSASGNLGSMYVGGFAGHAVRGDVSDCASYGKVSATSTSSAESDSYLKVGGFIGKGSEGDWHGGALANIYRIVHLGDVSVFGNCHMYVGNFLGGFEFRGDIHHVASIGDLDVSGSGSGNTHIGGFAGLASRPDATKATWHSVYWCYQIGNMRVDVANAYTIGGFIGFCRHSPEDNIVMVNVTATRDIGKRGTLTGRIESCAFSRTQLRRNILIVDVDNVGKSWDLYGSWGTWMYVTDSKNCVVNSDMRGVNCNGGSCVLRTTAQMKASLGNYPGYNGDRIFLDPAMNWGYASLIGVPTPLTSDPERLFSSAAHFTPDNWLLNVADNQGKPYPNLDYSLSASSVTRDVYVNPLDLACPGGWSGASCDTFSCRNDGDCHGATCNSDGTCSCPDSKRGKDCSQSPCGRCEGGSCSEVAKDTYICACPADTYFFNGVCASDEQKQCARGCGDYGKCVVHIRDDGGIEGRCQCNIGLSLVGGECLKFDCGPAPNVCDYGSCDASTGQCGCQYKTEAFDPYEKYACIAACPNIQHGYCTGPDGSHVCEDAWIDLPGSEEQCGFYDCSLATEDVCQDHGECVEYEGKAYPVTKTCKCEKQSYFDPKNGTCVPGCSKYIGHGQCTGEDRASCEPGWVTPSDSEDLCVLYLCGTHSDDSTVCNGHGTCEGSGCACEPGYVVVNGTCLPVCMEEGQEGCVETTCVIDGTLCNGQGSCQARGEGVYTCDCATGYAGDACQGCAADFSNVEGFGCVIEDHPGCKGGYHDVVSQDGANHLVCKCVEPQPVSMPRYRLSLEKGDFHYDETYGGCLHDFCADTCSVNGGVCEIFEGETVTRNCTCPAGTAYYDGYCAEKTFEACLNGVPHLSADTKQWVCCPEGEQFLNGICYAPTCDAAACKNGRCAVNEISIESRQDYCECDAEAELTDGKCVVDKCDACENGECQVDEETHFKLCRCREQFDLVNGVCIRNDCPPTGCGAAECTLNPDTYIKSCVCTSGQVEENGICYKDECGDCSNGECVADASYTKKCQCNHGYKMVGGVCTPTGTCEACGKGKCRPSESGESWGCVCDEGAHRNEFSGPECVTGECDPAGCLHGSCKVGDDAVLECVCNEKGAELNNGTCIKDECRGCLGGGECVIDPAGISKCVCSGERDPVDDGANNVCVLNSCGACSPGTCSPATPENDYTRTCECDPGYTFYGNACVPGLCDKESCRGGSCKLEGGALVCKCAEGFVFAEEAGSCYRALPTGCVDGTPYNRTMDDGALQGDCHCDDKATYVPGRGACVTGKRLECVDAEDYIVEVDGHYYYGCKCAADKTLASDGLTCLEGVCTPETCNPGACEEDIASREISCECADGYTLEGGACVPMPCSCLGGECEFEDGEMVCKCKRPERPDIYHPDDDEEEAICLRDECKSCEGGSCRLTENDSVLICDCGEGKVLHDGKCYVDNCRGCAGGVCTYSDDEARCKCDAASQIKVGYACYDAAECKATCEVGEFAGTCALQDSKVVCLCAGGYVSKDLTCPDTCGACLNGDCVPGDDGVKACQCEPHLRYDDDFQACVAGSRPHCSRGELGVDDDDYTYTCTCEEGTKFDGDDCVPAECGSCKGGICIWGEDGEPVCKCEEGYEFFQGGCYESPLCGGATPELVDGYLHCTCADEFHIYDPSANRCVVDQCRDCKNGECVFLGSARVCECILPAISDGVHCIVDECAGGCGAAASCERDEETYTDRCVCKDGPAAEDGSCYSGNCDWCMEDGGASCVTDEENKRHVCVCQEGYRLDASERTKQFCVVQEVLKSGRMSAGAIAGIVIAVLLVLAGVGVGVFFLLRKRKQAISESQLRVPAPDEDAGYAERDVVV